MLEGLILSLTRSLLIIGTLSLSCALLNGCRTPLPAAPRIVHESALVEPISLGNTESISEFAEAGEKAAEVEMPREINIQEALLMALEKNRALRVERLNPPIFATFEAEERAVFDPVLDARVLAGRVRTEDRNGFESRSDITSGALGLTEFFPTGTEVRADLFTDRTWGKSLREQHATGAELTVTQSLLRGFGLGPNLADLRQARLDTQLSEYELRGFAETLVADVESAYWDYVHARRQVEIVEESLKVAQQQLGETEQRVRVGSLAETELAAAQAEVALRQESLINARSRVDTLQVRLLRLINPAALADLDRQITPSSEPRIFEPEQDSLQAHLELAMIMRPDLNQARLLVKRNELEIVKTRNGLLPRMDLFVSLGRTGYADSFSQSVKDFDHDGYEVAAGVDFDFPVLNRGANARDQRARINRVQSEEALMNLEDLVREDVETAHIEMWRARQQVDATAATRYLQEEKLRAETTKFRVGKSTGLLVATAQRDLLQSQVSEVLAVTNYLKAVINFHLIEGSLLERRGISAPGGVMATQASR